MKMAISVPDGTFERAERIAKRCGMNRSEFYSAAVARYATELESADLTAAIDAAVDATNADDSTRFAVATSPTVLASAEQEW